MHSPHLVLSALEVGDCPKTKLETQSNTRYSNVNSEQTQNGVESESKSKVFGQTGGGDLFDSVKY